MENGDFLLIAANEKWKRQISVCLLKTEVCFPWAERHQRYFTNVVSANVPIYKLLPEKSTYIFKVTLLPMDNYGPKDGGNGLLSALISTHSTDHINGSFFFKVTYSALLLTH
jgi:hypothetical protein